MQNQGRRRRGGQGGHGPPNILLTSIFLFNFILINILNKLAGAYP